MFISPKVMKEIYIYREHLNYCCAREVFAFSKMQKNGIPSEDMTLIIGFFILLFYPLVFFSFSLGITNI